MENISKHMRGIISKGRTYSISTDDYFRLEQIMSFKTCIECNLCEKSIAFANYICYGYIKSDGS